MAEVKSEKGTPWRKTPWSIFALGAVAAAVAEALLTQFQWRAVAFGFRGSLATFRAALVVFGLDTGALVLLAALLGYVANRATVRTFIAQAGDALGGGDAHRTALAQVLLAWLWGGSVAAIVSFGPALVPRVAAATAVLLIVAVTLAAVVVSLIVTPTIASRVHSVMVSLLRRSTWLPKRDVWARHSNALLELVFRSALILPLIPLALLATDRNGWRTIAPFSGILAIEIARTEPFRSRIVAWSRNRAASWAAGLVAAGWFVSAVGVLNSPYATPATLRAETSYAPIAGAVLTGLSLITDVDGDGTSSLFAGGDCAPWDPDIHPGAREVVGNGVDEDCSGRDAHPFHPVIQSAAEYETHSSSPLSVVVIHMDTVRPDHTGFGGYARNTTPRLDAFRKQAVWFDHAYAPAPLTKVSVASLFTGRALGAVVRDADGQDALRPDIVTVAERLSEASFSTTARALPWVAFGINGIGRGFRDWRRVSGAAGANSVPTATETTDAVIAALGALSPSPTRRFFFFAQYMCAHFPRPFRKDADFGHTGADLYDGAIANCDREVGRVLTALQARSDWEQTAVIVYSDHGEELGVKDGYLGHGAMPSENQLRALLLVRVPATGEGERAPDPVSLSDLAPTVLAIAGETPRLSERGSRNLLPLIRQPGAARPNVPVFFTAAITQLFPPRTEWRGVIRDGHKYEIELRTRTERIYDLGADPTERVDLRATQPAMAGDLGQLVEDWAAYYSNL